jgi:hypothetical protein
MIFNDDCSSLLCLQITDKEKVYWHCHQQCQESDDVVQAEGVSDVPSSGKLVRGFQTGAEKKILKTFFKTFFSVTHTGEK